MPIASHAMPTNHLAKGSQCAEQKQNFDTRTFAGETVFESLPKKVSPFRRP